MGSVLLLPFLPSFDPCCPPAPSITHHSSQTRVPMAKGGEKLLRSQKAISVTDCPTALLIMHIHNKNPAHLVRMRSLISHSQSPHVGLGWNRKPWCGKRTSERSTIACAPTQEIKTYTHFKRPEPTVCFWGCLGVVYMHPN